MSKAPFPFDVDLDGHGYMIDTQSTEWRQTTIPLLRPAFISSDRVGENELNPEAGLRFSDVDWSHGAGQRRADLPDSDTSRFWRSRGVDVWTKWQVSLLPEMVLQSAPISAGRLFYANSNLYVWGNLGLKFGSPANPTSSVVTSSAVFGACTDAATVYYSDSLAVMSVGVGVTGVGTTYNTLTGVGLLFYVSGRLLGVSGSGHVIDIQSGSTTDDLGHLPGTFVPLDMTEAPNAIYVLGVNADSSRTQVFAITIKDDGTGLNTPVAVTPPFDGQGRRILYYEGLVFVGMANGVRMATPDSNGSLTVGPLITAGNCSALVGRNGKVWFGWDSYELDDTGTTYWCGFGRLDPTTINDSGAPAYAADVMGDGFASSLNPIVLDAAFTADGLLISLTTAGVYTARLEPTQLGTIGNRVDSGYIRSGLISFDLPDEKTARYLTVQADMSSAGTITPAIATDGSETFTDLTVLPAGQVRERVEITAHPLAGAFELRMTLARDASSVTLGGVLTRTMLQAEPAVDSGFFLYVPVILASTVRAADGQDKPQKPAEERAFLYGLRKDATIVTYTEPGASFEVTVEDIQWMPTHITTKRDGINATAVLKLKTV